MRWNTSRIVTAAFALLLVGTFTFRAEAWSEPATKDGNAADSTSAAPADSDSSFPAAPEPAASMGAAMPYSNGAGSGVPRYELFVGYSYLQAVPELAVGNRLVWLNGGNASLAFNLNRYLGLVADVGDYTNSQMRFQGGYTSTVNVNNANAAVLSYLFGPRLSWRRFNRITPFAQVLVGGVHADQITLENCTTGCILLPSQSSLALTAGGGLDVNLSRHFALRLVQAEYMMSRFTNDDTGAAATQNDMRLSAGVVFRFGGNPAPSIAPAPLPSPLSYSCTVTPAAVFAGEPIDVSGTALNLDSARTPVYTWTVDGGTISATSSTGKIDTTNVAAGSYTLKGHVSEGDKPGQNADCAASYQVRALEPPSVSCAADPSTVLAGGTATINATAVSPQNLPLTYSYSSTFGSVSGAGPAATLSTTGVPVGAVTVTCNVVDDKAQTASSTTIVTVAAPVAAPQPLSSALCSIHFDRDPRRASRVDNEAKACLDEVALSLRSNSGATLALVGNAASGEKNGYALAAERAVNAKAYLVSEKGIDAFRIIVYTGSQDGKLVTITLIPAGGAFDATADSPAQ